MEARLVVFAGLATRRSLCTAAALVELAWTAVDAMTAEARANGWRGFDSIGEKVDRGEFGNPPARGGWMYLCDGMPTLRGCGAEMVSPRRLARVGAKSTGWLVTYGKCFPDEKADDEHGNDLDVVLTFCPRCAAVVQAQDRVSTDQPA